MLSWTTFPFVSHSNLQITNSWKGFWLWYIRHDWKWLIYLMQQFWIWWYCFKDYTFCNDKDSESNKFDNEIYKPANSWYSPYHPSRSKFDSEICIINRDFQNFNPSTTVLIYLTLPTLILHMTLLRRLHANQILLFVSTNQKPPIETLQPIMIY